MRKLIVNLQVTKTETIEVLLEDERDTDTHILNELCKARQWGNIKSWEVQGPRNGLVMACGCWNWGMPGDYVGKGYHCPVHGSQTITQCNVAEPEDMVRQRLMK